MNQSTPNFTRSKLLPAIIQDEQTGRVLMLGFMNRKSYQQTLTTKRVTFWSRSRNKLWQKGETSGSHLVLKKILVDCDRDTILCLVTPTGPTCHTGQFSCFQNQANFSSTLEQLSATLKQRQKALPRGSYSASLFQKGLRAINAKITEEAAEVTTAAATESKQRLIEEIADLWFHLLVLMTYQSVSLQDITNELAARKK